MAIYNDPEQLNRRALLAQMGRPGASPAGSPFAGAVKAAQNITGGTAAKPRGDGMMTQGGSYNDPRWSDGTWGRRPRPNGDGYDGSGINPNPGGIVRDPATGLPGQAAEPAQQNAAKRLQDQEGRGFTGWGKYAGQMSGFDMPRYEKDIIAAGPGHKEYAAKKITVAQMASGIDPRSPDAVQQLVDKLKASGEDVEFDGLDRIRFKDAPQDGWIDVLRNKTYLQGGGDNRVWQWLDNHGGGGGNAGGGDVPQFDLFSPGGVSAELLADAMAPADALRDLRGQVDQMTVRRGQPATQPVNRQQLDAEALQALLGRG